MLSDLADTIAHLNAFHRREKVEIQTDDIATLVSAIERAGIPLVNRKPSEPATEATFMGVPVVINPLVPPGFAVVVKDEEVVNILDLRAKEETR